MYGRMQRMLAKDLDGTRLLLLVERAADGRP
jgi:hypothetical protein